VVEHLREQLECLRGIQFTLVFAFGAQTQVHQQCSRVLERVVTHAELLLADQLDQVADGVEFDHDVLRSASQTELLQGTESILSEQRFVLLLFQKGVECKDGVVVLQELAAADRVRGHGVHQPDCVLLDFESVALKHGVHAVTQVHAARLSTAFLHRLLLNAEHIALDHVHQLLSRVQTGGVLQTPRERLHD